MDETTRTLKEKIQKGEIEVNGQELFFRSLLKALMYDLNNSIKIRGKYIPHMIINAGDDQIYLANKGQDNSIEPFEVSNENYIYNSIPRCVVKPGGINLLFDQLTNPYQNGTFNIEYEDNLYTFVSKFRRMPVKMSVNLKYIFDTFTDSLEAIQKCITNLAIIRNYSFDYLGQRIDCSYQMSDSYESEYQAEFDGLTSGEKTKSVSFDIEIESNLPIYEPRTIMSADEYINMNPKNALKKLNGGGIFPVPKGSIYNTPSEILEEERKKIKKF